MREQNRVLSQRNVGRYHGMITKQKTEVEEAEEGGREEVVGCAATAVRRC